MERDPGRRYTKSRGYDHTSTAGGKSTDTRSRSPSPAPTSVSRNVRRRSRSPLRPRVYHQDHGFVREAGEGASSSSYRVKDHQSFCPVHRDWDQRSDRDRVSYSYRSSDHLEELRARRAVSSSRRRASREASKSSAQDAWPQHGEQSPQQVTTLSPTPSPPSACAERFPSTQNRYESSHRHHYRQQESHSRSQSRSRSRSRSTYSSLPPSQPHSRSRSRRQPSVQSRFSRDASGAVSLPFNARTLSRWDFAVFEPLFAHYLELHKSLAISKLSEDEVAGRWKSFIGKWNRGELAEGWYEPEMFLRVVRLRAIEEAAARSRAQRPIAGGSSGSELEASQVMTPPMTGTSMADSMAASSLMSTGSGATAGYGDVGEDSDDDSYGPAPPASSYYTEGGAVRPLQSSTFQGPAIPTVQDLAVRRELDAESRAAELSSLARERKADLASQKERLDELLPRADPRTRERQMEKRQMLAETMRAFRDASPVHEVGDRELMGGAGGFDDYKRMLATMQRRKTEREVRREEFERARNVERDERMQVYREREESTMERLREIARQRFGAGGLGAPGV